MSDSGRIRLLINCSNLHVGGGVAVATSFIAHLARINHRDVAEVSLLLSTQVHANLVALGTDLLAFARCEIADYVGLRAALIRLDRHFAGQDVVFTVFGPAYFLRKRTRHVFGFAQPLVIYPDNPSERELPFLDRLRRRVTAKLQQALFARADELIVELEHVKVGLSKLTSLRNKPTHIVHSAVDSVYRERDRWLPVELPLASSQTLRLGVVSRNYPHKNLKCLPSLKERLKSEFGVEAEFFVTFTRDEWRACSEKFRQSIHNVGPLKLGQCPSFYAQMDGVIFPSVMECFSAVPIESMLMRKPLFASDLPFIRDCCHEHANYFTPMDVGSMATVIQAYFRLDEQSRQRWLTDAFQFVHSYPGPQERAASYLRIALSAAANQ